jgi:glycine/D-amino acid oxidase-like deaminating enzyme
VAVRLATPPGHVLEQVGVASINRPEGIDTDAEGHFASTFSMVTARGLSVVGSTFLPQEPDAGSVGPLLLHRADRFVPGLHGAGVEELRACARPQSLDGRPLVGRVPGEDRLFIAAGHGPWGISTGPETARLVAELILGGSPDIPPELDPGRFPR